MTLSKRCQVSFFDREEAQFKFWHITSVLLSVVNILNLKHKYKAFMEVFAALRWSGNFFKLFFRFFLHDFQGINTSRHEGVGILWFLPLTLLSESDG